MYANFNEFYKAYHTVGPNDYFFSKNTLDFFGEKLSDMRLLGETHAASDGKKMYDCYVVKSTQHDMCGESCLTFYFFDVDTLKYIDHMRVVA